MNGRRPTLPSRAARRTTTVTSVADVPDAVISFRQRTRAGVYGPGGIDIDVNGVDRWELLYSLRVAIKVLYEWPELLPQILGLSDPWAENDDQDDGENVIPLFARGRR